MRQALAELRGLDGQLNSLDRTSARGAAGGTRAMGKSLNDMSMHALKAGNQLQWTGRQLIYNWTLPLGTAALAATKWQLESEKAMTRVAKVYGDLDMDPNIKGAFSFSKDGASGELGALERNITALSNRFGTLRSDVANIAADWAAAGSSGVALAKATELTLKAMVLGEMEAGKATEALISIQSQYGLSTEDLSKTLNEFNMIENQTGISMQGLIEGFTRTAGVARYAGITTRELGAMLAALVPATGSAANAGNALKTIISRLMSPTKEAAGVMKMMGINTSDAGWQSLTAAQRLELMSEKFMGLDEAQKNVVSTTVASRWQLNRFNVLMQELAKSSSYYKKAMEATQSPTKMYEQAQRELNAVLSSSPQRLKQIWTILQNASADVIQPLIPLLVTLGGAIAKVGQAFANLPPETQKLLGALVLLLIALGPIVRYLGSMQTLFFTVATGAMFFGKALLWPVTMLTRMIGLPFQVVSLGMFGIAKSVKAINFAPVGKGLVTLFPALGVFTTKMKALPKVIDTFVRAKITSAFISIGIVGRLFIQGLHNAVLAGPAALFAKAKAMWTAFYAWLPKPALIFAQIKVLWSSFMLGLGNIWTKGLGFGQRIWNIFHGWLLAATAANGIITRINAAVMNAYNLTIGKGLAVARGLWASFKTFVTLQVLGGGIIAGIQKTIMNIWNLATWTGMALHKALWIQLRVWLTGFMQTIGPALLAIQKGAQAASLAVYKAFTFAFAALVTAGGTVIGAAWSLVMKGFTAITALGAKAVQAVWAAMGRGLAAITAANGFLVRLWGMILSGMYRMTLAAWKGITGIFAAGIKGIGAMMLGVGKFLISPWGLAIGAIIGLVLLFKDQIAEIFRRVWEDIGGIWNSAIGDFTSIGGFFSDFILFLKKAFWGLPKEVQDAMLAVVRVVGNAAKQVYKLFSYLNPFARHSPSLVENVTNGMRVIGEEFKGITKISTPIARAYAAIKSLKDVTASLQDAQIATKYAESFANVVKFAPAAIGPFDTLMNMLPGMKRELLGIENQVKAQELVVNQWKKALDAASDAMDTQEKKISALKEVADGYSDAITKATDKISKLASAPLAGMRAMEDQIFANTEAQNRLKLEMIKLKQAGQVYEDIESKISNINGELESLLGKRTELTLGGADSSILAFYDDQIAALEAQKKVAREQTGPLNEMQKALDELQQKAEVMDLEKALAFDGLERQIKNLANTEKELTFEQITSGIREAQAEVAKYTPQLEDVNRKIEQQEAVLKILKARKDEIQQAYDAEDAKLQTIKQGYDELNDAIREVESSLQALGEAASSAGDLAEAGVGKVKLSAGNAADIDKALKAKPDKAAKEAKLTPGEQAFRDAEGGNYDIPGGVGAVGREGGLGDQSALIDAETKRLTDETSKMMEQFDMFAPIKRKFEDFKKWMQTNIQPAFTPIKDYFSNLFSGVDFWKPFRGDETLGRAGKQLSDFGSKAWEEIKKIGELLGQFFGEDIKKLGRETWQGLKELWDNMKPAAEQLAPILDAVWMLLKVILAIIAVVLKLAIKLLTNVIRPVFAFIGDAIAGLMKILGGLADIITGIFTLDGEKIKQGFVKVFEGIGGIVESLVMNLFGVLSGALGAVWDTIGDLLKMAGIDVTPWEDVLKWFQDLPGRVGSALKKFYDDVIGWFQRMADKLYIHSIVPDMINAIVDLFFGLPGRAIGYIIQFKDDVIKKFNEMLNWIVEFFKPGFENVGKFLSDPIGTAKEAIGNFLNGDSGIATALRGVKDWAVQTWGPEWSAVKNFMQDPVGNAKDAIKGFLEGDSGVAVAFRGIKDWMVQNWGPEWSAVKNFMSEPVRLAKDGIKAFLNGDTESAKASFGQLGTWMTDTWSKIWSVVEAFLKDPVDKAKNAINNFLHGDSSIAVAFRRIFDWWEKDFKPKWDFVEWWLSKPVEYARGAINALLHGDKDSAKAYFLAIFKWAENTFQFLWNGVEGWLKAPIERGRDAINRILDELKRGFEAFGEAAKKAFDNLPGFIKSPLERVIKGINHLINGFITVARAVNLTSGLPNPIGETIPGLKDGGPIPGTYNPAKRDNVLGVDRMNIPRVRVEPGEFVTSRKRTRQYRRQLEAIQTGTLPRYAEGGLIGGRQWPTASRRLSPNYGGHSGIDIPGAPGTPIFAAASGRISYTGYGRGYGNAIFQQFTDGLQAVYGHNNSVMVQAGQMVQRGQTIAGMGYTGNVRPAGPGGTHLHFEVTGGGFANAANRNTTLSWLNGADIAAGGGGLIQGAMDAIANTFGGFASPAEWFKDLAGKAMGPINDLKGSFLGDFILSLPQKLIDPMANKLTEVAQNIMGVMNGAIASGSMQENAKLLMQAGKTLGASRLAMKIALMTAAQESSMGTNKKAMSQINGDGDVGWFQQRATRGDGTIAQLADPLYSLGVFLRGVRASNGWHVPGLYDIRGWDSMNLGDAAQKVQVSAYPRAYDKWAAFAEAALNSFGYKGGTLSALPGWGWVGENGPELMKFRGGEQVKRNRAAITAAEQAMPFEYNGVFKDMIKAITPVMQASVAEGVYGATMDAARRIDARYGQANNDTISKPNTPGGNIYIQNMTVDMPNITEGGEAKKFVDNLTSIMMVRTGDE